MKVSGKYAALFTGVEIHPQDFPHHDKVEDYFDEIVAEYDISELSLPSIVQVKHLVTHEYPTHSFRIAVSGDIERETENPKNQGTRAVIKLAEFDNLFDGLRVVADIRKNYLRHYPGRCLRDTGESFLGSYNPTKVFAYIAFFDKDKRNPNQEV